MCIYPAAAATLHQHQQDLRILHSAQLRELETVIAELRLRGSGEEPANVKHSYMSTQFATGWRKHIGSPKLQIIFHKRATKYSSLLQEMVYKDKGSYASLPPCMYYRY